MLNRFHVEASAPAAGHGLTWVAFVGLCVVVCAAPPTAAQTSAKAAPTKYRLVWADEFNVDGPLDPADWNFEEGFVRNDELQWYTPRNALCRDGTLVIEARRERIKNPRWQATSQDWRRRRSHADYTSASATTRKQHEWLYGRFEIRAKIDARPGLWPAIWTLGSARPWPGCGEIDLMEYYREMLLANVAWAGPKGAVKWAATRRPLREFGEGWADRFHVWRMDWTAEEIRLSVDDRVLNRVAVATATNADRRQTAPFREPHYLLLNLAIGGQNGGDPSRTDFPARLEVDYVRVFQTE